MLATRKQVGERLGISTGRVHQLVQSGIFPKRGTLDEYVLANEKRESANGEQLDLTAERARVAKEQADKLTMENAERRGELVEFQATVTKWRSEATRVKNRLLAMPSKLAPLMIGVKKPAEAQSILEQAVHEALSELSQPD